MLEGDVLGAVDGALLVMELLALPGVWHYLSIINAIHRAATAEKGRERSSIRVYSPETVTTLHS